MLYAFRKSLIYNPIIGGFSMPHKPGGGIFNAEFVLISL